MYTRSPVIVMEVPEQLAHAEVEAFLRELQPLLENHRPWIVLDCSLLQRIESAGVDMLIHCLEEAMKRDGDLKLAAVSPESAVVLELMRVDRLFEVFDTTGEAVRSFRAFASAGAPETPPWYSAAYKVADFKAAS